MGCAQLEQLDTFVEAKRQIARRYRESLASLPGVRLQEEADWAFSTYWMFTMLVDEKESCLGSRELLRELAAQNIQTRPLWQPIHRSPAHNLSESYACSIADTLYNQAISLPCSVGLTDSAQSRVIAVIASLLGKQNLSARVSRSTVVG
jgi:dTDP-4-amino-4,6-dideoxygalactose transaminase